MNRLVILRGIPASGKSHFARTLKEEYDAVICSADHHFETEDGTYVFNPSELGIAHQKCQSRALRAMAKGVGMVVVDNTASRLWEFALYLDMAKALRYEVRVVRFMTDLETCLERNQKRPKDRRIPPETITSMCLRMEPFDGEELKNGE